MVGTEALGKWLAAPGLVEQAADADAVDMRRFDAESDDTTCKDIHDDHHPEALQEDGFASEQVDAPKTVTSFSDGREPRWTVSSALRMRVLHQNPTHHVLVDRQAEGRARSVARCAGSQSAD